MRRAQTLAAIALLAASLMMCSGCQPDGTPADTPNPTPPPATPPFAHAGPDQRLVDTDLNGEELVTLDGSASAGDIASYRWLDANGTEIAQDEQPVVVLSVGTHTIQLEVADDGENTALDEVIIAIDSPDNESPVANAGNDITVTQEDDDEQKPVTVQLGASGSFDRDGTIRSYLWLENGEEIATGPAPLVAFNVGVHVITLEVTDDGGAMGDDLLVVNVLAKLFAHAGDDMTIGYANTGGNFTERVPLSGRAGGGAGGYTYRWEDADQEVPGRQPVILLPIGIHTITLTVEDQSGAIATDDVIMSVVAVSSDSDGGPITRTACGGNVGFCRDADRVPGVDVTEPDCQSTLIITRAETELVSPGRSPDRILMGGPLKFLIRGNSPTRAERVQLTGGFGPSITWSLRGVPFSNKPAPVVVLQRGVHFVSLRVEVPAGGGMIELTTTARLIVNPAPRSVFANAGESVLFEPDDSNFDPPFQLLGAVIGGIPPDTFSWASALGTSPEQIFDDPTVPNPMLLTFDPDETGLTQLRLTVTDANGTKDTSRVWFAPRP